MGQTFHIRNVSTGETVLESSAGISRRMGALARSHHEDLPPGIFVDPPLIGDDWSPWHDPAQDRPPETGIPGRIAEREMEILIAALQAMPPEAVMQNARRDDIALLESLRDTFAAAPDSMFAGFLYP